MLKELKLKISQQELFNFLTELQLPQRISLGQFKRLINRIENKAETIEAEHDIAMAWEAVGGNENKIDTIRVSELQRWSD